MPTIVPTTNVPTTQLVAQYNRAINALQTKLSRQQNAAIDTSAQIDAFRALVAQLEGKK